MRHDKRDTLYLKLGHDNADGFFDIFKKETILTDTTLITGTKFRACLLLFHLALGNIPGSDTFFLPLEYWTMDHVQETSGTMCATCHWLEHSKLTVRRGRLNNEPDSSGEYCCA